MKFKSFQVKKPKNLKNLSKLTFFFFSPVKCWFGKLEVLMKMSGWRISGHIYQGYLNLKLWGRLTFLADVPHISPSLFPSATLILFTYPIWCCFLILALSAAVLRAPSLICYVPHTGCLCYLWRTCHRLATPELKHTGPADSLLLWGLAQWFIWVQVFVGGSGIHSKQMHSFIWFTLKKKFPTCMREMGE